MLGALRRARRQLTAICALGTGAVLVAMAAAGLRFSLAQLDRQSRESFASAVKTVVYHVQSQAVLDASWLSRTEADNALWIAVESDSAGLQHTRRSGARMALTAQALEQAREEHGFAPPHAFTGSLEAQTLSFEMRGADGENYFACVAAVPRAGGWLQVAVVRDRAGDRAAMRWLSAGFALCVVAGVTLLVGFAWVFSGRVTRPVEESHRRQTAFVAAASHELRAPLSVIRMSAGTIRRAPEQAGELAGTIERESERMSGLIADLLFLARADDGRSAARMAPVSARAMLRSTVERFEPIAAQKGVRMELALPEESLPDVRCDRQLVEQALAVLCDNALRYAPAGGRVRLRARRQRLHLLLEVDDSGPGVPEEERERIFERFYRADAARSDREHYGLGLSIAAEIAALHHTRIRVEESDLGGARFALRLRWGSGEE